MLRFYESTLFKPQMPPGWRVDPDGTPRPLTPAEWPQESPLVGIQVLASPPIVDGVEIDYEPLLNGLGELVPIANVAQLRSAISLVASSQVETWDPSFWDDPVWREEWQEMVRSSVNDFGLADAELVAVEASPLHKRALAEIAALSTSAAFVLIGHAPSVVLTGTAVGLVIARPLSAVTGALWEGGRPHVVQFGDDTTKVVLDALRRKLGIPPEQAVETQRVPEPRP